MKNVLILGSGRSSSSLIKYLLKLSGKYNWHVTVGDADENLAQQKVKGFSNASAIKFDVFNTLQKDHTIDKADLVISMLPVNYHFEVLKSCLKYGKNFLSASYVSEEIKALKKEIEGKGILVIKECGLDPGLDHMSAMQVIEDIKKAGGTLLSFRSYAGGLIAPEYDNNPWGYKFTWNPRNVVLAGQGTAKFIRNGEYKFIPYHKLFTRTDKISINGYGEFEAYANRDSLSYRSIYNIENIPTILRGTLRRPGYCSAWNVLVQLGLTDDSYLLEMSEGLTNRGLLNAFLPFDPKKSVEEKFLEYTGLKGNSEEYKRIEWLGLFKDKQISIKISSPAMALKQILDDKWALGENDKDMIVLQHQFEYQIDGLKKRKISELVCLGDNPVDTAMAKTVGLPLGIAAKLILTQKLNLKAGLYIPVIPEIYNPVLQELENLGIRFHHQNSTLT